jgi:hypothetical protein
MNKFESCLIIITYLFSNMTLLLFYRDSLRLQSLKTYHIVGLQVWIILFSLWPELDPVQSMLYVFLQMIIIYFITQNTYNRRAFLLLNLLSVGLFLLLRQEYYHLIRFFIRVIKTLSSTSGILVLLAIALIVFGIVLIKYKKSNFLYFIFFIGLAVITIFSFVLLMNYEDWAIATSSKYSIGNDQQTLKDIIRTLCIQASPEFNARIHDMLLNWYPPTDDRRVLIYLINMLIKEVAPENVHDINELLVLLDEFNRWQTLNKIRHFTYYLITYMFSIYFCIAFGIVLIKYKKSNFIYIFLISSVVIMKAGTILLFIYEYWAANSSGEHLVLHAWQILKAMIHTLLIQMDSTVKHIINEILLNWYPQADDRRALINIINKLVEQVEPQQASDVKELLVLLDEFNRWQTANRMRYFIIFLIKFMFSFICLIFVNKKNFITTKKKYL